MQPSRIRLNGWGWFLVWALLGSAVALGFVSLGALVIVPVLALGVFLWTRPGPGTTCWHTATASGCDQYLNPIPWLVAGGALLLAGLVAHARRT